MTATKLRKVKGTYLKKRERTQLLIDENKQTNPDGKEKYSEK